MNRKVHLIAFLTGGFFLFLDQIIKWYFFHHQNFSWYLVKPWVGLEYFQNPGIAFGIPLPTMAVVLFTPFVILFLLLFLSKEKREPRKFLAATLIIVGAISNFTDRVLHDFVIDYIRLFTSLINVADIIIVVGAGILILPKTTDKVK